MVFSLGALLFGWSCLKVWELRYDAKGEQKWEKNLPELKGLLDAYYQECSEEPTKTNRESWGLFE